MDNGWENSAAAWIADMGEDGDFARKYVLDRPMIARIAGRGYGEALDLGCGEGRFCRIMAGLGLQATGIDPTPTLLAEARRRDPGGRYIEARAETLPFADGDFDLVVSYLTLIDIDDMNGAVREAARVLRHGGRLLIANLNPFNTAGGWQRDVLGEKVFVIDDYLQARDAWVEWRGIRIRNWHRPQQDYMQAMLDAGLRLTHFAEPAPVGAPESGGLAEAAARYARVPYFQIMEWEKPG